MVLESLLAVLALCVAGAAATNGALPAKTPFAIFSSGVAGFFAPVEIDFSELKLV